MKDLPYYVERFRKMHNKKFNQLEIVLKKTKGKNNKMEQTSMSQQKKRIGFWVVTIPLVLGMASGGIAQLIGAKANVDGTIHLGYPPYVMYILGTWKILGVIILLIPKFQLVKEWAYAGFFFAMTGAVASHIASGDSLTQFIAPLIFAVLTVLSWWLRPDNRKLLV